MATVFSTDFESYGVTGSPTENQSLLDNGWVTGTHSQNFVQASNAHSGSKSVKIANGAIERDLAGPFGASVTMEMWAKADAGLGTAKGPSLQIASTLGSDGSTRWIVGVFTPDGTDDLELNLFDTTIATAAGVIVTGTYQQIRMAVRFSTVNDTLDDVNEDGCVSVFVDGVRVINQSNIRVAATSVNWATGENYWDILYFDIDGYVDDVLITDDEVTCASIMGSAVFGMHTTVTASRAVAFGLDGNVNTLGTPGMAKFFGNVAITGDLTVDGSTTSSGTLSADLDALGT